MFQGCGTHHTLVDTDSEASSGSRREPASQGSSLEDLVAQRRPLPAAAGHGTHQVWGNIDVDNSSGSRRGFEDVVFNPDSSQSVVSSSIPSPDNTADFGLRVPGTGAIQQQQQQEEEAHRAQQATAAAAKAAEGGAATSARVLHESGACMPCRCHNSAGACAAGDACSYCHLPHGVKKTRVRPCKSTRLQCKQVAAMVDTIADCDQRRAIAMQLSSEGKYMKQVLDKKMQEQ